MLPSSISEIAWPLLRFCRIVILVVCIASAGLSQQSDADNSTPDDASDPALTMFPHSQTARWWVSGQDNIISQWHPSFDSKYSGPNSFHSHAEHATSNIATLFTGLQLTSTTEI